MESLPENRRKVLILAANVGSGHMRAAQAVARALSEISPPTEVKVEDILERGYPLYCFLYRSAYLFLARRFPRLLDRLYKWSDPLPRWLSLILLRIDRMAFCEILREIDADPPDLVLCTHFLPLEILSPARATGEVRWPLWGVVTDLYPHGVWFWAGVDHYFVAERSSRERLRQPVPNMELSISTSGIPVDPSFAVRPHRGDLLEQMGLPDRKTVLLLSGGEGLDDLVSILESFVGFPIALTLIAIAGKNGRLFRECRRWADLQESRRLTVRVHGFVQNMPTMMGVADLVVTKPGGLTLFEALALGKPLVLLPARGGQEGLNRRWAVEVGAATACDRPRKAGSIVRALFEDPDRLSGMASASARAGRPGAATLIARDVVCRLSHDALSEGGSHGDSPLPVGLHF